MTASSTPPNPPVLLNKPFSSDGGLCWTSAVEEVDSGDGPHVPETSELLVCEDGEPLGPSHQPPLSDRRKAGGRSTVPGEPHLQPGKKPRSDTTFGYGYQWWLPPTGDEGEYSAIGVYNQFIYVNPTRGIVIAKTSASQNYGADETTDREIETLALFSEIARSIGHRPSSGR